MNTPEFEAFTNHWAGCRNCHPMHDIYCVEGRELWITQTKKMSPQYVERIKKAVVEKFKARIN